MNATDYPNYSNAYRDGYQAALNDIAQAQYDGGDQAVSLWLEANLDKGQEN